MRIIISIIIFCIFLVSRFPECAEGAEDAINLTENDRVLILAPHPDDEAIGTCSIIQKALKQNAKVRVVCYTNGDSNEPSFIVYEKRLTFRKGEFLHMGEVRRRETMRAMVFMGVKPENITFLGYPDFGTLEIFTKYWGNVIPYKGLFTRVSKVSYPEAMSMGVPYAGESILADIKKIILDFKPTKIFVSHPGDVNRDHRSLYLFLQVALWDLEGKLNPPEIFPYIIHVVRWPIPRGYHPELGLERPDSLANSGIEWYSIALTQEELKAKRAAISFYKSQIQYNPSYLFTFCRSNELFGDFPVIRMNMQDPGETVWHDLETIQNIEIDPEHKKDAENNILPDVAYAARDNRLLMRFQLRGKVEKDLGVSVFVVGYTIKIDFSKMPKIYIKVDNLGVHVRDKKQFLEVKDVEFETEDNILILKIPFSLLGNPDRILTCARTYPNNLPLDETAWRVIYLQ
ncbi:MAG: PIG-L family deacetylase [Candidatus Omnitrophica bacterium]|nr:PIG-L family deacetylase [Candidatus Omnitrophota bacterium]